jgi:hypothetical protein
MELFFLEVVRVKTTGDVRSLSKMPVNTESYRSDDFIWVLFTRVDTLED